MQDKEENIFKMVFIGGSRVGKTSFVRGLMGDVFVIKHKANIGVDFNKKTIGGIYYQFWEANLQYSFSDNLAKMVMRNAKACVIIVDLSSKPEALEEYVKWWVAIIRKNNAEAQIRLLGCKSDILNEATKAAFINYAANHNYRYHIVSAKNNEGMVEFEKALEPETMVLDRRTPSL